MPNTLWLRAETKPLERRTALTPKQAADLKAEGSRIVVESSELRTFEDAEYKSAGCEIIEAGSWRAAPKLAFILGLKELPEDETPLEHRHVYFAHLFKKQEGAELTLARFRKGGGTLFDLEYLVDDTGRRIAAFGYWAGYVGAALGAALFGDLRRGLSPPLPSLEPFDSKDGAVAWVKSRLKDCPAPKPMVIGALGRSGRGASDLLEAVGCTPTKWDLEETKAGGPFPEILDHDLLLNCVLVTKETPPFLTREMLRGERQLSAISDVACDPQSPCNPLPIYDAATTMTNAAIDLRAGSKPLWLTAIDHLPSLLPRESSEDFSEQLLPHLKTLLNEQKLPAVFGRAEASFRTALSDHT